MMNYCMNVVKKGYRGPVGAADGSSGLPTGGSVWAAEGAGMMMMMTNDNDIMLVSSWYTLYSSSCIFHSPSIYSYMGCASVDFAW